MDERIKILYDTIFYYVFCGIVLRLEAYTQFKKNNNNNKTKIIIKKKKNAHTYTHSSPSVTAPTERLYSEMYYAKPYSDIITRLHGKYVCG